MTGEPVRDLKYIEWVDPDAWMENMSGPRWDALVKKENARLRADPAIFAAVKSYRDAARPIYRLGPIKIKLMNGFTYEASWDNKTVDCGDIDYYKGTAIYSHDIGKGAQHYRLEGGSWHKDGISSQVAIVGTRIYFLRVQKRLWSSRLCSCKLDGTDEQEHYKEEDPRYNLTLFKGPGRRLFLLRENCGTIEGASLPALRWKPIENAWQLVFPRLVESADPLQGLHVTRSHGERTLLKGQKELLKIVGHVWFDPYQVWDGHPATIFYSAPNLPFQIFQPGSPPKFPYHSKLERLWTKSADGRSVPYVLVSRSAAAPKGLLVNGYGAYGLATNLDDANKRWGALLDAGWAIAFALIRGGGDHDSAWFRSAQCADRHRSFEDFEAVIVAGQRVTGVNPQKTVIYGRSAGGFLVGAALNRNHTGKLFKGVYAEVPYVDVLRTTTNPTLPLTAMEYDEFGNPRERIEDFLFLLENSPCNNISPGGKITVLCRTAENDSQVYAYESMKWITRLRAAGNKALLVIKKGEGHFAPEDSVAQDIAEDFTFWLREFS